MSKAHSLLLAAAALVLPAALATQAAERRIVLLPTEIALSSREARQTLVVQWQAGEAFQEQAAAADVKLASSDEKVVKIEKGHDHRPRRRANG
jgi:hypothetical protein